MNLLPEIGKFDCNNFRHNVRRLFIAAEGFEERSLEWIRSLSAEIWFDNCFLCKYLPEKKARLNELLAEATPRSRTKPDIIEYHRFMPSVFEQNLDEQFAPLIDSFEEIVIDISVMSKLMIMSLLWYLNKYDKLLRIIYTEPMKYAPSRQEYEKHKNQVGNPVRLPSSGVHEVVRTSHLSSVVMQQSPMLVVAFNSFNEQLIRALLSSVNPSRLFLINGIPPHLGWREQATQEIHAAIIKDYATDNPIDPATDRLQRRTSTLDFKETFEALAEIYREFCFTYRIVLAPTGSKMQTLGCSLFKACCPDVHVEYPIPESYIIKGYSSEEVRMIHEVRFENLRSLIKIAGEKYKLNG